MIGISTRQIGRSMSTAGVPFLCVATFVLFSYKRILTIFAMLYESKCISAKITLFTLKKDSQSH